MGTGIPAFTPSLALPVIVSTGFPSGKVLHSNSRRRRHLHNGNNHLNQASSLSSSKAVFGNQRHFQQQRSQTNPRSDPRRDYHADDDEFVEGELKLFDDDENSVLDTYDKDVHKNVSLTPQANVRQNSSQNRHRGDQSDNNNNQNKARSRSSSSYKSASYGNRKTNSDNRNQKNGKRMNVDGSDSENEGYTTSENDEVDDDDDVVDDGFLSRYRNNPSASNDQRSNRRINYVAASDAFSAVDRLFGAKPQDIQPTSSSSSSSSPSTSSRERRTSSADSTSKAGGFNKTKHGENNRSSSQLDRRTWLEDVKARASTTSVKTTTSSNSSSARSQRRTHSNQKRNQISDNTKALDVDADELDESEDDRDSSIVNEEEISSDVNARNGDDTRNNSTSKQLNANRSTRNTTASSPQHNVSSGLSGDGAAGYGSGSDRQRSKDRNDEDRSQKDADSNLTRFSDDAFDLLMRITQQGPVGDPSMGAKRKSSRPVRNLNNLINYNNSSNDKNAGAINSQTINQSNASNNGGEDSNSSTRLRPPSPDETEPTPVANELPDENNHVTGSKSGGLDEITEETPLVSPASSEPTTSKVDVSQRLSDIISGKNIRPDVTDEDYEPTDDEMDWIVDIRKYATKTNRRQRFSSTRRGLDGSHRKVLEPPSEWDPLTSDEIANVTSEGRHLRSSPSSQPSAASISTMTPTKRTDEFDYRTAFQVNPTPVKSTKQHTPGVVADCSKCQGTGLELCSVCLDEGWIPSLATINASTDIDAKRVKLLDKIWMMPNLVVNSSGEAQCVRCNGIGKQFCGDCLGSGSALEKGFNVSDKYKAFDMFGGSPNGPPDSEIEELLQNVEEYEDGDDEDDEESLGSAPFGSGGNVDDLNVGVDPMEFPLYEGSAELMDMLNKKLGHGFGQGTKDEVANQVTEDESEELLATLEAMHIADLEDRAPSLDQRLGIRSRPLRPLAEVVEDDDENGESDLLGEETDDIDDVTDELVDDEIVDSFEIDDVHDDDDADDDDVIDGDDAGINDDDIDDDDDDDDDDEDDEPLEI